jgi:hypothetical protein
MSQTIGEYLYEGKYSVDTLEAFCDITADIISQYIPLKKFVEVAERVPHEVWNRGLKLVSCTDPVFQLIMPSSSVSGMNLVLIS